MSVMKSPTEKPKAGTAILLWTKVHSLLVGGEENEWDASEVLRWKTMRGTGLRHQPCASTTADSLMHDEESNHEPKSLQHNIYHGFFFKQASRVESGRAGQNRRVLDINSQNS